MDGSPDFFSILTARYSRRSLLRGAGAALLAAQLPMAFRKNAHAQLTSTSSLTFKEVARGMDEMHHLAEGYQADIVARWGDAVSADAPAFDFTTQSAEAQAKQFGFNNDFIAYFPIPGTSDASSFGLLCVNHEYTSAPMMFSGVALDTPLENLSEEQHRIEMAAQGVSILEVWREKGQWRSVSGPHNRRITVNTPMNIDGPAAGHKRMKTKADPQGRTVLGTLGNCAGGMTPWGTYLTCEENIDYFFNVNGYNGPEAENHRRMTMGATLLHRWDLIDPRFDIAAEPNEPNRFGWVVEIDPFDRAKPVKHTALGRFKHEGASPVVNQDGRLVVFMGDDERFQFIYRFISAGTYDPARGKANRSLLEEGTLYAAKFDEEGSLTWLPLIYGQGPLTAENGFNSMADVLIEARRAAELMGATPMDRPEDIEVNPVTGNVFACLTNNAKREEADSVNRRAPNPLGYVLEMLPPDREGAKDYAADQFRWEIFLEGGDPQATDYYRGHYQAAVSANGWLSCPDNMAFDPKGRIWITTDGQPETIKAADSIYAAEVSGPWRGATRCFFRGPIGCEVTGPRFTPDGTTLFVSIQHPGEDSTADNPVTRWPDFDEKLPPRPAILAITKTDGGEFGS